jgi:hypothetical protein
MELHRFGRWLLRAISEPGVVRRQSNHCNRFGIVGTAVALIDTFRQNGIFRTAT